MKQQAATRSQVLLLIALSLGCGTAAVPNLPVTTTNKSEAPEATALGGGAFSLDFKIWKPEAHGNPSRLVVTYKWGDVAARTVEAQLQNDRWHVVFPDQPKPQERAEVRLRYEFELSDADKTKIQEAARTVLRAVLTALHPEPGVAPAPAPQWSTSEALSKARKAIAEGSAATTLRAYGASSGADGLSIVLKRLGIEVTESGDWKLAEGDAAQLVGAAAAWSDNQVDLLARDIRGYAARLVKASRPPGKSSCEVPSEDPTKLDAVAARSLLSACVSALQVEAAALDSSNNDAKQTQTHLAAELQKMANATPMDEEGLADAADQLSPAFSGSYSYLAVRIAESSLRKLSRELLQRKQEDALLAGLDIAFEDAARVEDGATLLSGAARPRRYDISTGVVYVQGLQDAVVPTLVSICFWEGCLAPDDVAWDAKNGWKRALSLDAGVRIKTLDTRDLRQSDQISFLVGASYNPVTVLRLSAGFYAFENAQTHNWNGRPYFGVTVNVLNAAEILGRLGLGELPAPATDKVK